MTAAEYHAYLRSDTWRERADEALAAAGYRCRVCNGVADLQAHHRTYDRVGHEAQQDLTVLCRSCHRLYETARRRGRVEVESVGVLHAPDGWTHVGELARDFLWRLQKGRTR